MLVRRDEDEGVQVSLTTFMDIAFLLLIFFLVTASLRKPHKELSLELPDAGAAKVARASAEEFIISIDRDGVIHMSNQSNISNEELHRRLQELAQQSPQPRIRLDVDQRGPVQHMARIMDLCQGYGLNHVGVRTRN